MSVPTHSSKAVPDHHPVLVRFEGLQKSFGGQAVLDGISGEIRAGEVILLRGENGSGKTTLLNILTGCLEPDGGLIEIAASNGSGSESFRFPRPWHRSFNTFDHFTPERVTHLGISRTWQDIRLIPSLDLADNIAAASGDAEESPWSALVSPRWNGKASQHSRSLAYQSLADVGLAGRENSSADKISLGQSKRVAIARAIAADARVLFLDEPLAGLDRDGLASVLALLESLVARHRITLVIVEHVFNFVHLHHLVTAHWKLAGGQLEIENAFPIPKVDSVQGIPVVTTPEWLPLLASPQDQVRSERLPRGAILTRILRQGQSAKPLQPALEVKDLIVKRGARPVIGLDDEGVLAGLNLTLNQGEIAILQAPNGWGKSSLFGCLAGVIPADSGSVTLNSRDITTLPAWDRPSTGLHLNTAGGDYFRQLSIADVQALARSSANGSSPSVRASRSLDSLSGGQLRRVSLATFLHRTNLAVSLLDEPFLALDREGTAEMARLIRQSSAATLIAEPCQT